MILSSIEEAIRSKLGFDVWLELTDKFADACINPRELNKISRDSGKDLQVLTKELIDFVSRELGSLIQKAEYSNGFFNITFTDDAISSELSEMFEDVNKYLEDSSHSGKTVVFDYSSPNIAKPFSVGHLRSTIIGQANLNCHKTIGYKTIGINHLGDWGTQFGKLIVAIKKWGDEGEIEKNPIVELNRLYVKFHDEAEKNPELEEEAREWFSKLEKGDEEARRLWKRTVDWSFVEFERIYEKLGVKIDNATGESFYEDKLEAVVSELKEKNLTKESEGALIVELEDLPPALIKKSDGSTLYLTRDLAALKFRISEYSPAKIVYHVGNDQSLHFKQLEAVARKLGWLEQTEIFFAGHGLLRLPEGKMSTRKGRVILLDDLIGEAVERSEKIIDEKNPELKNKDEVAQKIGVSAIKYSDLSQNRNSDIVFSFDRAITLEGNSGPYLQYSYARSCSLINKYEEQFSGEETVTAIDENSRELALLFLKTKYTLETSAENSTPNMICELAFKIANAFNSYYEKERIITDDAKSTSAKIFPVYLTKTVLGKLLDVLGVSKLEQI